MTETLDGSVVSLTLVTLTLLTGCPVICSEQKRISRTVKTPGNHKWDGIWEGWRTLAMTWAKRDWKSCWNWALLAPVAVMLVVMEPVGTLGPGGVSWPGLKLMVTPLELLVEFDGAGGRTVPSVPTGTLPLPGAGAGACGRTKVGSGAGTGASAQGLISQHHYFLE